jgi:hypothetical protein
VDNATASVRKNDAEREKPEEGITGGIIDQVSPVFRIRDILRWEGLGLAGNVSSDGLGILWNQLDGGLTGISHLFLIHPEVDTEEPLNHPRI